MNGAGVRVSVLGVGIMGAPMARNLARAGFAVRAWNRTPEKARVLQGNGVTAFDDAHSCVEEAAYVILMLTDGPACDAMLFGAEGQAGVAEALAPGATVIVMSSIPVETSKSQAKRLAALGVRYVDAPVSGGEKGAVEASLSIMAGGDGEALAKARHVLEALGRVTHVGPVGTGQLAKLANQLIVGVTIGAISEALLLVEAGGGDPAAVHQALQGGFADSTIWRQHGARILEHRFAPGAYAAIQYKDLATVTALAARMSVALPFAELARTLYADMCANGRGELDHSALYLHLSELKPIAL